ncbi:MAG: hypothetical protein HYW89_04155 [Candidatus Sungiibacteriota bacterium]|uniref:Uncharacterized protein n=1 Tax=Candidatus Sungiibacteriota bacterium TaxID=2750080 RepID=A0A7T5RJB6_9BACT|nr:MAG: hypothetical protein HYW89_04155 [Candidatus Sungbacteria bacterium]
MKRRFWVCAVLIALIFFTGGLVYAENNYSGDLGLQQQEVGFPKLIIILRHSTQEGKELVHQYFKAAIEPQQLPKVSDLDVHYRYEWECMKEFSITLGGQPADLWYFIALRRVGEGFNLSIKQAFRSSVYGEGINTKVSVPYTFLSEGRRFEIFMWSVQPSDFSLDGYTVFNQKELESVLGKEVYEPFSCRTQRREMRTIEIK